MVEYSKDYKKYKNTEQRTNEFFSVCYGNDSKKPKIACNGGLMCSMAQNDFKERIIQTWPPINKKILSNIQI